MNLRVLWWRRQHGFQLPYRHLVKMLKLIRSAKQLAQQTQRLKKRGLTIGFVPTMGYLHEGHLSLMRIARQKTDILVVSIFVNPSQFAPHEDLDTYPRALDQDIELLESVECDVLFLPTTEMMYPSGYKTWIVMDEIMEKLCGKSRSAFFRGVATVVTKLFNSINPHVAVFGQKDAQQALIIKRLVADLNMNIEIVIGPLIREADGLAMSSRNAYLSSTERNDALILNQALRLGKKLIQEGILSRIEIIRQLESMIESKPSARLDYIEIVHGETLEEVSGFSGLILLALAVSIGKTRLIDNILITCP